MTWEGKSNRSISNTKRRSWETITREIDPFTIYCILSCLMKNYYIHAYIWFIFQKWTKKGGEEGNELKLLFSTSVRISLKKNLNYENSKMPIFIVYLRLPHFTTSGSRSYDCY